MVHQCNAVHRSNGKIPIQISIGILSQGVVLHSCIVVSVCNSSKFSYQQSNIDNICLVLGLFPSCIRCAKDDLYRGPTCHFHVSLRWRIQDLFCSSIFTVVSKLVPLPFFFYSLWFNISSSDLTNWIKIFNCSFKIPEKNFTNSYN